MRRQGVFARFANRAAAATGHPLAFGLALLTIVVWAVTGPVFGYSDTWQLVINTGTTIVTFLMVFLIQNAQNRDGKALQIKLDELIRALEGAHNALLDLEQLSDEDIDKARRKYCALAADARKKRSRGRGDTDQPDVLFDD
ncbi:MAG TPA: low affinity iron permease family protein [Alphaproteobacteria bacterium]|jgi:low affinity Fe/Cu permease|nr:low affinity iron permease family protein [Alphaproteobacteria bacterium]